MTFHQRPWPHRRQQRQHVVVIAAFVYIVLAAGLVAGLRPSGCGVPAAPPSRPFPLTVSSLPDDLTNITQVPWHVGVYDTMQPPWQKMHRCGGTIVSTRVVVTAAHCVWDTENGSFFQPGYFCVGLGKHYRSWNAAQPLALQQIWVKEFRTPGDVPYVPDSGRDLVLLVLSKAIEFKAHVQPICLEDDGDIEKDVDAVGLVGGWGLLRSETVRSPLLKVVHMNAIERSECWLQWPYGRKQPLARDQMCGNFTLGQSVCDGDDGGGLAVPRRTNGERRYYLRGVVGVLDYMNGTCDRDTLTVLTDVRPYLDEIRAIVRETQNDSRRQPGLDRTGSDDSRRLDETSAAGRPWSCPCQCARDAL